MCTDHNFLTERRAEADSNRGPTAYRPSALQLGQTGSSGLVRLLADIYFTLPATSPWIAGGLTDSVAINTDFCGNPCSDPSRLDKSHQ